MDFRITLSDSCLFLLELVPSWSFLHDACQNCSLFSGFLCVPEAMVHILNDEAHQGILTEDILNYNLPPPPVQHLYVIVFDRALVVLQIL